MKNTEFIFSPEVKKIIDLWRTEPGGLIMILHKIQELYGNIPKEAINLLAKNLNISIAKIYGVITFYHFYHTEQSAKFIIHMCKDMPCKMQEAAVLAAKLEQELGIKFGETTSDGMFTLEWASCIGMCDQGPAMLINFQPYTKVKPEEVRAILEQCKKEL